MKKTAVIILNYITWQDTLVEIDNLRAFCDDIEYDIVVIDNCSPNESSDELAKLAEKYKFVFIKANENKGYASGNNIGIRYAFENGYEYSWILNNDIIFESNILSKMIRVLAENSDVAVVSPRIKSPEGYEFNLDAKYPTFYDLTLGMYQYKKKGRELHDEGGWSYVYRPQGCCMLVNNKLIDSVHYMDEKTFLYFEENILAERFLRNNYRCAVLTDDYIIHNHSKTVKSVLNKKKIIESNLKSYEIYLNEYREYSIFKKQICKIFLALKLLILD